MNMNIYMIGGAKGGVGKSLVSLSLIDYLTEIGQPPLLIESDTGNPDVWKSYKDQCAAELINLDIAEGWISLINAIDAHKDKPIVINTAVRNGAGVTDHGALLCDALPALHRRLITLWVINRQRDSLELMRHFMEAMPAAKIHVVRNSYFGSESEFALYNNSETRKLIETAGGKSLTFPDLADRVADDIYSRRLTLANAAAQLPIGNKAELQRFRAAAATMFKEIAQ
jgi:hypothetical protein